MIKELKAINYIFGFLYALAIVFGYQCEYFGEINLSSPKTYVFIVILIIVATLFSYVVWEFLKKGIEFRAIDKSRPVNSVKSQNAVNTAKEKKTQLIATAIIWICYFITFLGVYPGFFVYDAQEELMEVVTRSFHNGQPIFHVLTLGGIIQAIHKFTGEYNISIAVYILLQMSVISIVLGFIVKKLCDKGLSTRAAYIFSLYLGAFPVLNMFALCSAKDGLFVAAMLIAFIYFRKLMMDTDEFLSSKKDIAFLCASSVLMMLLRSNGIYAYFVFGIIGIIYFIKNKNIKKIMLIFIISMVLAFGINKGLLLATNASSVGHREILTVPIQQLARVYDYDNDSLSSDEKIIMTRYINDNALRRYNPKCSDLVKIEFNEDEFSRDKISFLKTWLKVGIKHPVAYIDALFMTSYGLWYPKATLDGYKGNIVFTFTYGDSSYFGYEVEEPGFRDSKIPAIDRFYRYLSLSPEIHHIPIISLIFSPGFMLWVMLFFLGYLIYAKDYKKLIPYLLPVIVILTSFIGPMSLVRYSYYLWILVPFIAIDIKTN